jgi:type I restriction enzyme, S subunit
MTLADISEAIIDCEHKTAPTQTVGIPSIRTTDIRNGRLLFFQANKVSEETYREWTERLEPRAGDLLIAREAPVGEVGIVPEGYRVCLGQRTVLVRPNKSKVIPRFLLYLLLTAEMRHLMISRAEGSITPHLNMSDIRALPLPELPRISEQQVVADFLGALDDKIELNRRMNETLDAIARAIFKSWFVDFDPIRAKTVPMKFLSKQTTGLFPQSFENSVLGQVPKGWAVGPIFKIAQLLSGGTPKTECQEYWGGKILWVSAKDVSQCRDQFLITTDRTITERGLAESATQIVPSFSTVVVARGATTGRMAMLGCEMAMNQTCYALVSKTDTPFALYCQLRHEIGRIVHTAHGSVFETITTSSFENCGVLLPPASVLHGFEECVSPMFVRMKSNLEESGTLEVMRDALLPKLLSGEVRVKHAEKIVESHA